MQSSMILTRDRADNSSASQRKFLLIVDNNKSSSSGLKALLKQFHYKVWSVNTAAEALELSDIVMPALVIVGQIEDMPQVDFIKELKRVAPSGTASVIVISRNDAVNERACLSAGAVTCLKLPLNVETLYRTIQVAIEPVPRMNLRITTKLPVIIDDKTLNSREGRFATALSENGLFLVTPDPCPLNTRLPLRFKVAGKILSADAVVIYAHKKGNGTNFMPGMGLQFVRISDQDQEHIRFFIREEVRKGIFTAPRT
jgi:CheY-like chemotaxis protein